MLVVVLCGGGAVLVLCVCLCGCVLFWCGPFVDVRRACSLLCVLLFCLLFCFVLSLLFCFVLFWFWFGVFVVQVSVVLF